MTTKAEVLQACAESSVTRVIALLSKCPETERPSVYQLSCAAADHNRVDIFRHILKSHEEVVLGKRCEHQQYHTSAFQAPHRTPTRLRMGCNIKLGGYKGCTLAY